MLIAGDVNENDRGQENVRSKKKMLPQEHEFQKSTVN